MRKALHWPTLVERCFVAHSAMIFKAVNSMAAVNIPPYVIPPSRNLRAHHQYNFTNIQTNMLRYWFPFYPRTIRVWNLLPNAIVTVDSITTFKTALWSSIDGGEVIVSDECF